MAILLKEQLQKLTEGIHYYPPSVEKSGGYGKKKWGPFNIIKKGKEDPATLKASTQMFYDFYAMELMHRLLGSPPPDPDIANPKYTGKLTPQQVAKLKATVAASGGDVLSMYTKDWGDVEHLNLPKGFSMVPYQLRKVIDQVYEEVVIALSAKIRAHLRLSLIQEFRYIVSHAHDWQQFRQSLVSLHNKQGKISKQDFNNLIAQKIPGFKGHEDAVKRLLLFSKYYNAMSPDPADKLPEEPMVGKAPEEPEEPGEPSEPGEIEPEPKGFGVGQVPHPEGEPDDTDYDMPDIEIPPGADWSQDDDWKNNPEIEKAKTIQWFKTHGKKLSEVMELEAKHGDPSYASGRISPHTILAVRQAINKSGLTWNDILLGYQNLDWGGSFGGSRWGEGVASYIKLVAQSKDENIEEMAGVIDHIYDLEHWTGALLNKGGMFVSSSDLDRRAKITGLARYLPNVSPIIQRLILRVLQYTTTHPEIEKDIEATTESETVPFTPEEEKELTAAKFVKRSTGNEWTTQSPYKNKQGETVQNQYTVKHHTNGMYSARDSINADIQVFDSWNDFKKWLDQNRNLFVMPQAGVGSYKAPEVPTAKSGILNSHQKIKIGDAKKEQDLLDQCKMGWRPDPGSRYYKAYLPGEDRVQLFAFSDGSYMVCKKSDNNNVFHSSNWDDVFSKCKELTINALENPDDESKYWIGKPIDAAAQTYQPQPTPQAPSVGAPPQQAEYSLSFIEANTLQVLSQNKGGADTQLNATPEGFFAFQVPKQGHSGPFNILLVGKKAISPTGKKYKVIHVYDSYQSSVGEKTEEWDFPNWNQCYSFIAHNYGALTQFLYQPVKGAIDATTVTPQLFTQPSAAQLPPNSTSQNAYKVAVGIDKPPKNTIRLTVEDEAMMTNAGFEPTMAGSDLWYIHKKTKDTIKFYPNNQAKILFLQGNKGITVTKTIDDALEWIKVKYTAGAGAISPLSKPVTTTKGVKATSMFDKFFADAGFVWEPTDGIYHNTMNSDTIEIKPFPKSTVITADGAKTFSSLPALAAYLKNYATGVKKK